MSVRLCLGRLSVPGRSGCGGGGGGGARRLAAWSSSSSSFSSLPDNNGGANVALSAAAAAGAGPSSSGHGAADNSSNDISSSSSNTVNTVNTTTADNVRRRVGRAQQALQLKESRGHIDVKGARSTFSEFAASELTQLADVMPPGGGQDRWRGAVAVVGLHRRTYSCCIQLTAHSA